MIFYLLASINMALTLVFGALVLYYRHNPMISNRDWPLVLFPSVLLSIGSYLNAIGYELYFDGYSNWGVACRYLISWPVLFLVSLNTAPILCRAYNIQFKYYFNQEKAQMMTSSFYNKYKHTATLKWNTYFLIFHFFFWNIPTLIVYLLVPFPADPANVTQCFDYFTWILILQGAPLAFGMNYIFVRFLKLKDPYKIKTEFGAQFATGLTLFTTWIVIQIYDTATGGVRFSRDFQPMYLITLFCYNTTLFNLVYPVYLAYKETKLDLGLFDQVGNMRRTSSGEITVKTVLENEELFNAFKDTTIQYWCVETLLFVVAVEHYKRIAESERPAEAKKIYNLFLVEESSLFVNVNLSEAKHIAEEIHKGNFALNIFEGCYKDVFGQLEGILLRWKATDDFRHMITTSNIRVRNSASASNRSSGVQIQMETLQV